MSVGQKIENEALAEMLETKEKIITLLDMMSEKQSENLLKYIKKIIDCPKSTRLGRY